MKFKRTIGMLLAVSMIAGLLLMVVPSENAEEPVLQAEETVAEETVHEAAMPHEHEDPVQSIGMPVEDSAQISGVADEEENYGSPSTLTIAGAAEMTADGTENYRLYAEEGDTISFGPSVLEEGEFTYRWQKWDGESYLDISLAENATAESAELTVAISAADLKQEGAYRCVISSADASAVAVFSISDEIPVCATADETILLMREQMKQRVKYISVISGEKVSNFNAIYEHTGVPTEGDYLKNHSSIFRSYNTENEDGTVRYDFTINYVTTAEQEAVVDDLVRMIVAGIDTSSNYNAICDIYTYIRKHVSYDRYRYNNIIDYFNNKTKQTAYGALIDGLAVCEGYSSLFYRLALECGVDARMIFGKLGGVAHAWNYAQNDDGIYYGVDATNDLFMFGETAYEGKFLYPNPEFLTDEFTSQYPMVWDIYTCVVDCTFDEATKTMTVHSNMPTFVDWGVYSTCPWTDEIRMGVEKVIFEEKVTRIIDYAFKDFVNLKSVKVPDHVTYIGESAFENCENLEEFKMPAALTKLGSRAFWGSLKNYELVLPEGVKELPEGVFGNSGITKTNITHDTQLLSIGPGAFDGTLLEEFWFPDSVQTLEAGMPPKIHISENNQLRVIGKGAFAGRELMDFSFPEGIVEIGDAAFKTATLANVKLPNSVVRIGNEAFYDAKISSIELPENLQTIGDYAFAHCALPYIRIPAQVRYVGNYAFGEIETIRLDPENPWLKMIDGVLFNEDGSQLLYFPKKTWTKPTYTVPDGVVTITDHAFNSNKALQEIVLPDTLKEISINCFGYCSNLISLTIPESVTKIARGALAGTGLTEIKIPGSVEEIDAENFWECAALEKVIIREGVKNLKGLNFIRCPNLAYVQLPSTLEELEEPLFYETHPSLVIGYTGTEEDWNKILYKQEDLKDISRITLVDENGNPRDQDILTVSFDGNGAKTVWEPRKVQLGAAYGELPVPVREGAEFFGWFTAAEGGIPITSQDIVANGKSHTLYAHWEDTIVVSGAQDTFKWALHNSGELAVGGNGAITDFAKDTLIPWYAYRDDITEVTVYAGTTIVGNFAFSYLKNLTSVSLPEGLVRIGMGAFQDCSALTEIVIPEGTKELGESAFDRCIKLASVTFPDSLKTIGGFAFRNCDALATVSLPKQLSFLGSFAFSMNDVLKEIYLPNTLTFVGDHAFYSCTALEKAVVDSRGMGNVGALFQECTSLREVVLPEGLTEIGIEMFFGCTALEEIRLPNTIRWIDDYAFCGCTALKKAHLGRDLLDMGTHIFLDCTSLAEVYLPDLMHSIGNNAFMNCSALESVTLPSNLESIGHGAFFGCTGLTDIEIPVSVNNIGVRSFQNCSSLTSVRMMASVSSVSRGTFEGCSALQTVELRSLIAKVEDHAFNGCTALEAVHWCYTKEQWENIEIEDNNTPLLEAEVVYANLAPDYFRVTLDAGEGKTNVSEIQVRYGEKYTGLPTPVREGYLFKGWYTAQTGGSCVEASHRVTRFEDHTLYARWVDVEKSGTCGENVTWKLYGNGVLIIQGEGAIDDYTQSPWVADGDRILHVVIEDGIMGIGNHAFDGCSTLISVSFPATLKEIGEYAFYQCASLGSIWLPESVTLVGDYAFARCQVLTKAVITSSDVTLGKYIFNGCSKLRSAAVPKTSPEMFAGCTALRDVSIEGGTAIEESAFSSCNSLVEITLPDSITEIKDRAFYGCVALKKIHMPEGLLSIGQFAFVHTLRLEKVDFPDTLQSIGASAFWVGGIKEVYLPDSVTQIGEKAFWSCNNLTTVRLSPNCKFIPRYAFDGAPLQGDLEIPEGVTQIGASAFMSSQLSSVTIPKTMEIIQSGAFGQIEELKSVVFYGDAVYFSQINGPNKAFLDVTATVYYPDWNGTWTDEIKLDYGGSLTWSPFYTLGDDLSCEHVLTAEETAESCQKTYTLYSCQCGYSYRSLPYEKHSFTNYISNNNATCTKDGTQTAKCDNCSRTNTIPVEGSALGHDWDEGTVMVERIPCQQDGVLDYVCSRCKQTRSETVPAHELGEWSWYSEATCTEPGEERRCCALCDYHESRITANPLGHTPVADAEKPATCTEPGLTEGSHCDSCGAVLTEQIVTPAMGHTSQTSEGIEASCEEIGWENGEYCAICGQILQEQDKIPALGHQWDNGVVRAEPTAQSTGICIYTCERCEVTRTEIIPALEHVHRYEGVATDPTCTQQGYTIYTCSCGDSYVDAFVDTLGHSVITDLGKDATCTESGLTDGTHCDRCSQTLTAQETIPALGHEWDEGTVTLEPTEETTGIMTYTCERCGETTEAEIPTVDHVHSYNAVVTDPTCTEQGYTTYTCRCGDSYVEDILDAAGHNVTVDAAVPAGCTTSGLTEGSHCSTCGIVLVVQEVEPALGHQWDEGVETVAPTEYSDGIMTYTCDRCEETKTEPIPALEHVHSYDAVVTDPTCTEQGYTTYTCSCGEGYKDALVDAIGHDYGDGIVTIAPGCETAGERTFICKNDPAHTYTEAIEAVGHAEGSVVVENRLEATCETNGHYENAVYCDVCKKELSRDCVTVPATGHTFEGDNVQASSQLAQEATCEIPALYYAKCLFCDKISDTVTVAVGQAKGHMYDPVVTLPTCTEQGFTTHTCTCGKSYVDTYTDALGHTEIVLPSEDPTCAQEGLKEGIGCSRCGEILVFQETIPALGHDYIDGICTVCGEMLGGSCGKNVNWVFNNSTGVLTIYGTGEMKDYLNALNYPDKCTPWLSFADEIREVVVEDGVVRIGRGAFENCVNLRKVLLSEGITSIGFVAFSNCQSIPEIDLPLKLQKLEGQAFRNCDKLKSIIIPYNVTHFSERVFDGCSSLTEVIFQGNAPEIPWTVFSGITATIYYPKDASGWTKSMQDSFLPVGPILTWKPYDIDLEILDDENETVTGSTVWFDLNSNRTSMSFSAMVLPEYAYGAYSWEWDKDLASVIQNQDGTVTIIPLGKPGTMTLTARADSGWAEASISIKFVSLEPGREELPGEEPADVALLSGKSKTLKIYDADTGKALTSKQITWTIDDRYAPYVKLDAASGKLTAQKVVQKVRIEVVGRIIGSENTAVSVFVDIYPAVTNIDVVQDGTVVNGKTVTMDHLTEAMQFAVDIYPLDAMKGLTWSISDTKGAYASYEILDNVLTVTNPTGKAGTVTVKVTSADGSKKTATFKIQFAAYATDVEIDKSIVSLTSGDKAVQLKAAVTPDTVTKSGVVWSLKNASDKAYVTLTSAGKLTPKTVTAPQRVTVIATSKDGMAWDEHTITIYPKSAAQLVLKSEGTYVTKTTQVLDVNQQESITIGAFTYGSESMESVTWTPATSKYAKFRINEDGSLTVQMIAAGSVKITAKASDGRTAIVTVKGVKLAQSVEVSQKTTGITEDLEVASGKSLTLQATVTGAASKKVTWTVENGKAWATISSAGKLTAAKNLTSAKTVTVRATAADGSGIYDEMEVVIRPLAQGVQIYSETGGRMLFSLRSDSSWWVRSNTTLKWDLSTQENTIALSSHVFPYYGDEDDKNAIQKVTWKSSSAKIATVDEAGMITVHTTGTVTITATAADGSGQKVSFKLTVVKTVTELTIGDQTVKGGKSLELAKKITIAPKDATNKKLTWKITDGSAYATISSSGVFKAKKVKEPQIVEVTVSSQDGGASAVFYVTITP